MRLEHRYLGTIRLALAMLVVVQHSLDTTAPTALKLALEPFELGSVAVFLFFTVSGFIVMEALDRVYRDRPVAFIANRMLRIAPTYWLALAVLLLTIQIIIASGGRLAIIEIGLPSDTSIGTIFANALAILPGGGGLLTRTGAPAYLELVWALRIEILFYIVLFLLAIAANTAAVGLPRVLAVAGAAALALAAIGNDALRGGSLEHLPYFVLGVAAYFIARRMEQPPPAALGLAGAAIALIVAHLLGQPDRNSSGILRNTGMQLLVFSVFFATMGLLIAGQSRLRSAVPKFEPIDRLAGELTYPLYLFHVPALALAHWLSNGEGTLAFVLGLALSIGLAAGVALTFERRIARYRAAIRRFETSAATTSSTVRTETHGARQRQTID
jgi:peptidoglycan/LPS O-acetylase OafA/YrhL